MSTQPPQPPQPPLTFEEHKANYFHLLDHPVIQNFLMRDYCCVLADNYHLMTVFHYFRRANFSRDDFTIKNFFTALFLSHEIYEDVLANTRRIVREYLGKDDRKYIKEFLDYRFRFMQRMDFNANMEQEVCEYYFKVMPHPVWQRIRNEIHTGVILDESILCRICLCPRQSVLKFHSR